MSLQIVSNDDGFSSLKINCEGITILTNLYIYIYIYNRNFWSSHKFSHQHIIKKITLKKKNRNNSLLKPDALPFPFHDALPFPTQTKTVHMTTNPNQNQNNFPSPSSSSSSSSHKFLQTQYTPNTNQTHKSPKPK